MTGGGDFVGALQAAAARSRFMSKLAVKLKGQCDSVIGRRLSSGIDLRHNGEGWLADRIAPDALIFADVGANLGAWSLYFAKRMARANGILLEPAPKTVARLREVIASEQLVGLEIIAAAAGDQAAHATFCAEPGFGETSSLVKGHSLEVAELVTVPVVTLDQVLHERGIETLDMLKIDAEGYDLRVIFGARKYVARQAIKVIQFEYNAPWVAAGSTLTAAYGLLEQNGYTVRVLQKNGLWRFDPVKVGEFYRYANFVAWCPGPHAEKLDGDHASLI